MSVRHWLQLALTEGIGPILTVRLILTAGSAEKACGANPGLLREIEGIGRAHNIDLRAEVLIKGRNRNLWHQIARVHDAHDICRWWKSVNGREYRRSGRLGRRLPGR